jgi:class 3 adenylate cyclase
MSLKYFIYFWSPKKCLYVKKSKNNWIPDFKWLPLLFLVVSVSLSSCNPHPGPNPKAFNGILDLQKVSPENRLIQLEGEWEFYPNLLLDPGEFKNYTSSGKLVPSFRNIFDKNEEITCGTYRLILINHHFNDIISISNRQIFSAFKLFINGDEIMANGLVATKADNEEPCFKPELVSIYAPSDTLEFVLQVSSHNYTAGSVDQSFVIGETRLLTRSKLLRTGLDFFLLGSLLIMGIYYLSLFLALRKDLSSLYFGIFILISLVRILVTGERLMITLIPSFTWETLLRLEYITFYLAPAFFVLFFHTVFKEEVRVRVVYFALATSVIFTLSVLFSPVRIFTQFLTVFQIYIILIGLSLIFWLGKALKNKKEGALVLIFGFVFFFIVMLHDMAFSHALMKGPELFPFGIFIFILCQSYILSIKYSDVNKENQELWKELDFKNQHLEQLVNDRTQQLENQKNLLQATNRELEQKREMMIHQSRLMEDINELLEKEKEKADELLLNVLPRNIADELKLSGKSVAHKYPQVSVLFVDFVAFSDLSENINAEELLGELHYYFAGFDDIAKKYNLEKIKTIGDAWMCAGGLHDDAGVMDVKNTVLAALEIKMFVESNKDERQSLGASAFDCRIGIHTGPVIAGVVGKSKFSFDIWGPTVNIAKRMEAACEPGMVNISEFTYQHIQNDFECVSRGIISMKHKKNMQMFYVERPKKKVRKQAEKQMPKE